MFKRSITLSERNDSYLSKEAAIFGRQHEFADFTWYPSQHKVVYRIDDRVPANTPGNALNDFLGFRSTASLVLAILRTTEETQESISDATAKCSIAKLTTSTLKIGAYGLTNNGQRKFGFVTGTCSKESYREELHEQWETCNAIVLCWIMNTLHQQFKMKDLGDLKYLLGIEVLRSTSGIILNQRKYILELIADTGLSGSKPAITPLEFNAKLTSIEYDQVTGALGDELLSDISSYQRLVGKLIQFMQHPKKSHWEAATRVVRYLKGSVSQEIWLKAVPATTLTCWCDSDWAACPNTIRSVTGYVIHFCDSLISWKFKKQHTVSRSSAEAEYRSMASAVAELTSLVGLFQELEVPITLPISVYSNSNSAIQLTNNLVFHERTKHIEINCHFIRDKIKNGLIKALYVQSSDQLADLLTKGLSLAQHTHLLSKLGVLNILHPAA
ncbi:putative adenylate isopentenyltransferase 5, chloroplastic-like [Capsicum annuum]|nr:putative adenylate isopentenyltransferase 5, chloroplastic-like [Capsicum annuum]